MRLHRLEISAFLAFAGRESIDIDALSNAGLFLFCGRTGAGKTSILDAICFALYGMTPGDRQAQALRSHHAADDITTEVLLEATIGGKRLRIIRSPQQERVKTRGEGTTVRAATAHVVELLPDGQERVLATRAEDAGSVLTGLLAMSRKQFCRVVLLPQGSFAEVLTASSSEREQLLRDLFDLGRFRAVEKWLHTTARERRSAADDRQATVERLLVRAAQAAGLDETQLEAITLQAAAGWLAAQIAASLAAADAAATEARRTAELSAVAAQQLRSGQRLAELQADGHRALAALAAEHRRDGEIARMQAEAAAAARAAPVAALISALTTRVEKLEQATATRDRALIGTDIAAATEPATLRAEAGRYRHRGGELAALIADERMLAAEHKKLSALDQRRVQLAATCAEHERTARLLDRERPLLVGALDEARRALAALPGSERARDHAAARAAAADERDRLRSAVATAHEQLISAREEALSAGEHHNLLIGLRLDTYAATLATELTSGEPCPVCGACTHPAPAAWTAERTVTDADVKAATARVEQANTKRDRQAEQLSTLKSELAAATATAGPEAATELATAAQAAQLAYAELSLLAADERQAAAKLADHDAKAVQTTAAHAEHGRELAALQAEIEAATTNYNERRDRIDRARGGYASIAAQIAALDHRRKSLEHIAQASEQLTQAAAEVETAQAAASAAATEAGFGTLTELQRALRDEQAIKRLTDAVAAHERNLALLKAATEREDLVAASAEPVPDLQALTTAQATAAEAAAERSERATRAKTRHEQLTQLVDPLKAAVAAAIPAIAAATAAEDLAALTAGGAASNRLRMGLSSYVLAARLEQIAAAASERLLKMTAGRFELEHVDDGGRRGRGGLDLRVIDNHTGAARPPQTLSGGETFQASLALALGLSDVVTAESGGTRIDTLFIDEGFGALDNEGTLDDMLTTLDELREGGRAIGIVSHVEELRQRIGAQLLVERRRSGSTIRQATDGPTAAVV